MKEKCIIVSIEGTAITAAPFSLEACASCTADCSHKGTSFEVSNPQGFALRPGTVVSVTASKKSQAVQGILSLLVPFTCALAMWFCAPLLATVLPVTPGEPWKALCVLAGLFGSAAVVLLVTRKKPASAIPQIAEVLDAAD